MITCPECGQTAPDDAKFCDRCGQGLSRSAPAASSPTRPTPLAAGATLKSGVEIVELISQTSIENRYRAKQAQNGNSATATITLRERFGPTHSEEVDQEPLAEPKEAPPAAVVEDPNGPRAKTAELRPSPAGKNGASSRGLESPRASAQAEIAGAEASAEGGESGVEIGSSLAPAESTDTFSANEEIATASEEETDAAAPENHAEQTPEETEAEAAEDFGGGEDLGEVFGRVLALSQTISHPAFQGATSGFRDNGRVYLVYADERLTPLGRGAKDAARMSEADAVAYGVQLCQAISFLHRRGLRLNDICPESVAIARDGRLKLTGLDYVSNDNELQSEPIFNDGYTAPEIYRGKKVDKRADIFSAGALLYTWLTGSRIPSESWREDGGPVQFYPPHVVTPRLENAIRRAIAFSPADRWHNVDEFKAELIALSAGGRMRAAAMTDVGRVREHNEDSVLAIEYTRESMLDPAEQHLYVVADGMGGAEAGANASAISVSTIPGYI